MPLKQESELSEFYFLIKFFVEFSHFLLAFGWDLEECCFALTLIVLCFQFFLINTNI